MNIHEFYRDKKVWITGHTGFKGAWLIHLLKFMGARIGGYALAPKSGGLFALTQAGKLCKHTIADIRNKGLLQNELLAFQPDIVFHLAAQPLVLDSYRQPAYTFEVNLMGTVYLMEALRNLTRRCATVIITTDKVYEDNRQQHAHKETDRLGGLDPYSASKATVELAVSSYRSSFFPLQQVDNHLQSLATARAGNVIGGGDNADNRIMPDIANALIDGMPVMLRHPQAVRPWQHVLDALNGYLLLAARLYDNPRDERLADAWNFGPAPKEVFTVEEITKMAINYWGNGRYEVADRSDSLPETKFLSLDPSKAQQQLHWHPRWTAEEAVAQTMWWYKEVFVHKHNPREATRQQIKLYFAP